MPPRQPLDLCLYGSLFLACPPRLWASSFKLLLMCHHLLETPPSTLCLHAPSYGHGDDQCSGSHTVYLCLYCVIPPVLTAQILRATPGRFVITSLNG